MAQNCFDDFENEALEACLNTEIQAGLSEVGLHYALHAQIQNFPMPLKPGEVGFNFEKSVVIEDDIEFFPTKGFAKINFQADMGELKVSLVGNKGNKKGKQTLEFYVAGNDVKTLGFFRSMKNIPMVFIATERDGQKRVIGDAFNPAYMAEVEGTTGKGGEDDKGINFVIESYGNPIVYKGVIQQPAEVIPGA